MRLLFRSPRALSRLPSLATVLSVLLSLTAGVMVFCHLWQIQSVPRGLYQDESAIGYNALRIAETGHDEHGTLLPLYFESFGDYKSPVYIYSAALLFKVFGPSVWMLRLTSALFFFGLLWGLVSLARRMSVWQDAASLFALLAGGFLPWFFTLSRLSFEVISEVTVVTWALYALYRAFEEKKERLAAWAAVSGALFGLSVYTYPTARAVSFGLVAVILALYARKVTLRKTWFFLGGFFASLLPYALYAFTNASSLTARFHSITYLYDPALSAGQKIALFLQNYGSHFGLDFLLLQGDGNLRHAIGTGGEIFVTVLVLAAVGCFALLWNKEGAGRRRFSLVLLAGLLLGPAASALTNDGIPHALRSVLLGLFFVLLALRGLDAVLRSLPRTAAMVVLAITIICCGYEAMSYVRTYFVFYPAASIPAFGSYDLEDALTIALAEHPRTVVITPSLSYAHAQWYGALAKNPDSVPLTQDWQAPAPGICFLTLPSDTQLDGQGAKTDVTPKDGMVRVRCY